MCLDAVTLTAEQKALLAQLAQSRVRVLSLAQEGKLDQAKIYQVANTEAELSTLLQPMPLDPAEHVLAAHANARPYLERLTQHRPGRIVVADERHTYTPRTILRRILDHALDHFNQVGQWVIWQQQGIIPTPAHGWATSEETLDEDLLPLSLNDLQAWLWRIDVTIGMVANSVRQLSMEQLDWIPPGGGWSLRRVLHHLASAEVYYAIWMDEALPDEMLARYSEANQRFKQRLHRAFILSNKDKEHLVFFSPVEEHVTVTAERIAQVALAEEQTLLNS